MQQEQPVQVKISNEEAQHYASSMMRGIQNSIFSTMNSNQNTRRSETYSVNYERWRNYSERMQPDWLISNGSFQTRNAHSFDSSCSQKQYIKPQENGYKIRENSPPFSSKHNTTHENSPVISAETSKFSMKQQPHNVKPGKKCPVCSEINSPKSNWCMECGKAIISVEVRRYDTVGKPCDKIVHSPPHQYRHTNWNDQFSPPKHQSFDDQLSPDNINVMMNNIKLDGYRGNSVIGTRTMHQDNYYEEGPSSISFDFENPQFEDLHNPNFQYAKHHAVYRRPSHNGNCGKEREDFYPFDDLLYPEFAIYDSNLGYAFPSSNIVSNGGYYCQQIPMYQNNPDTQHLQNDLNKRYQSDKRNVSRNKRRWKKPQSKVKINLKSCKSEEEEIADLTSRESSKQCNDELCHWGLPEEIILHIFSFLKMNDMASCLRVCKNFNRLASDGNLWKQICLKKHHSLTDDILEKIAKKKPVSLTLTQCNGRNVTMNGLRVLFQNCANSLQKLDISCSNGGALIGETVMLHAFRCKNIHTLDISWSNVSCAGIQSMSEAANRLVHLSLNGCQTITNDSVETIVKKHGESLETLEVFGCFNISTPAIDLIGKHCKNLSKLNVGQCHKISNGAVSSIANNIPKLKNLDLRGCKTIRDNSLRDISLKCKDLTTLVIANCPCITDATLGNLAVNLKTLECLDACGCGKITDRGVSELAKGLTNLKMLDISSTKATSRSVSVIASECKKSLTSLKLSFCHPISDHCLRAAVTKCTKLQIMHLYGCRPPKILEKLMEINPNLKIERESLR